MKIQTPKYYIGDKVYLLEYGKIVEKRITGIATVTDYNEKKFDSFRYFTDFKNTVESYGWQKESDLFISRSSLIESL